MKVSSKCTLALAGTDGVRDNNMRSTMLIDSWVNRSSVKAIYTVGLILPPVHLVESHEILHFHDFDSHGSTSCVVIPTIDHIQNSMHTINYAAKVLIIVDKMLLNPISKEESTIGEVR
jgi:hypothetical protein